VNSRLDYSSIVRARPAFESEIAGRRAVWLQIVRDQSFGREGAFLKKLAHQFQRGMHVSLRLDEYIEDLALGVDRAPEIDHPAGDFQIYLVQTPDRMRPRATLAQVGRDDWPEVIDPAANGLKGDRDPPLSEQILDISKAERKPEVEPLWGTSG